MHLWHKADANKSRNIGWVCLTSTLQHRSLQRPGYYLYHDDVAAALSDEGRKLIAVHSDREITTTRALLTRNKEEQTEVFFIETTNGLHLPGGIAKDERAIPDWDLGNHIAPCQQHLREQVQIDTPWLSYVGDYPEDDGLCRVYGYAFNDNGFPVSYDGIWLPVSSIRPGDSLRIGRSKPQNAG